VVDHQWRSRIAGGASEASRLRSEADLYCRIALQKLRLDTDPNLQSQEHFWRLQSTKIELQAVGLLPMLRIKNYHIVAADVGIGQTWRRHIAKIDLK
jgi:hypothetical protein